MVDKYIKELLIEHGRVYIPGLGLIYKDYKTSDQEVDPYNLVQPKINYLIDGEYRNEDDTWLAYAVARGEHVTLEDAEALIKDSARKLQSDLNDLKQAQLDGIGTLYLEAGGLVLINNPDLLKQESDDQFGMPSQIAVTREVYEPVTRVEEPAPYIENDPYIYKDDSNISAYESPREEQPYVSELNYDTNNDYQEPEEGEEEEEETSVFDNAPEKKSKTGILAIAAVLLLLILGGAYFYVTSEESTEDPLVEETLSPSNPNEALLEDSTLIAQASLEGKTAENNDASFKKLSILEKGKRYYIIAGAFSLNENAEKMKRQFQAKGIKAKVLKSRNSQEYYRVSLADFDKFEQALSKTEVFRNEHGSSIWILKY